MAIEIERKFLVKDDAWKKQAKDGVSIKQGYLNSTPKRTVRVRTFGDKGLLTIKGQNHNLSRQEFEYQIPLKDAIELLAICEKPIIEKTRFLLPTKANIWEIDVFAGQNQGLIVAEIELKSEEEHFDKPSWLGKEVSFDAKYYNSSLIAHPFVDWID